MCSADEDEIVECDNCGIAVHEGALMMKLRAKELENKQGL